jgi:methylmalonyl-CoA/ethylmalonyl-CoA epimerase
MSDLLDVANLDAVFDHACVAAPRIRDLLPLYHDILAGRCIGGWDVPRVGFRALQLEYGDGSRFELMEPLRGSTFLDSFFARGGGLHHVTFKVADVLRAARAVEASGYRITGLHLDDPDWREVFVHPRSAQGVLVQLAEVPADAALEPEIALDEVLAGRGYGGNGEPSP